MKKRVLSWDCCGPIILFISFHTQHFFFRFQTGDKKKIKIHCNINCRLRGRELCILCIHKRMALGGENFLSTMSCASLSVRNKTHLHVSPEKSEITFQFSELKVGYPSCFSILHLSDKLFFLRFNIIQRYTKKYLMKNCFQSGRLKCVDKSGTSFFVVFLWN